MAMEGVHYSSLQADVMAEVGWLGFGLSVRYAVFYMQERKQTNSCKDYTTLTIQ